MTVASVSAKCMAETTGKRVTVNEKGYCKYYNGPIGIWLVHFLWSSLNPYPNLNHIPKTIPNLNLTQ